MPSIYCDGDSLSVHGARDGNRLPVLLALFDIETDPFEHAGFGGFDRIAESVNARKILAVSVILAIFLFDGYGIGVVGRANQGYLPFRGESSIEPLMRSRAAG